MSLGLTVPFMKGRPITGREIRELRANLGLDSATFAKAFGVNRSTVHHWERLDDLRCDEFQHELMRACIARIEQCTHVEAQILGKRLLQAVVAGGMIGGVGALVDFLREDAL